MQLEVYKKLGSYCIASADQSNIIIDEIGSQRDANLILKAINDGVLSVNGIDIARQHKRMRESLEQIEIEVTQYSHQNRLLETIENLAKQGLGKID